MSLAEVGPLVLHILLLYQLVAALSLLNASSCLIRFVFADLSTGGRHNLAAIASFLDPIFLQFLSKFPHLSHVVTPHNVSPPKFLPLRSSVVQCHLLLLLLPSIHLRTICSLRGLIGLDKCAIIILLSEELVLNEIKVVIILVILLLLSFSAHHFFFFIQVCVPLPFNGPILGRFPLFSELLPFLFHLDHVEIQQSLQGVWVDLLLLAFLGSSRVEGGVFVLQ